ncbi:MAG TPA: tellurite resistance/C4-dicarboxylate transporter family protein [Nocardioides sp.]|nr:tellurite resistance/C4-dicarboxylate transporter family protein [Nocardioides sp.]
MPRPSGSPLSTAVRGLTPGYFALVMSSGILSIGFRLRGDLLVSRLLLAVAVVSHVVLLALTAWRLARHSDAVREDFADPRRAFGFFTLVAGTDVLAIRCAVAGQHTLAAVLVGAAVAAWIVLGYVVPWTAVLGRSERPVLAAANGTWFIWVVATQSVAAAAATLEVHFSTGRRELAIVAVGCWSVGVFLYAAAGMLVALRLMLYPFGPEDLTPPYWVAMGAAAITVVAGARIVEMADAPMVDATRGLVAGLAVVFWAFATWLIPVLVAAGWWRHARRRIPLRYEPTLWSIVFPLGMYGVASFYLGDADRLPLVHALGAAWLWLALAVWVAVFVAMCRSLLRLLGVRAAA